MRVAKISNDDFLAAHVENHKNGGTIDTLADKLGMKKGTAISRLNTIRRGLRDRKLTDEAVNHVVPLYGRVNSASEKDNFLSRLEAEAKSFIEKEADQDQTEE